MSVETTTIHDTRPSTVSTGVSYASDYRWHKKNKSKGSRSGMYGGQVTCSLRPIHFPGYVTWRWLSTGIEKWAGAPSCMNQPLWSAMVSNPCSNSWRICCRKPSILRH
ncbi:hypothetical protein TNCV_2442761 [Trichonephila clavipes]|nr:hypothetical protein TNCV_2442761 [Trichonephila clavipes]